MASLKNQCESDMVDMDRIVGKMQGRLEDNKYDPVTCSGVIKGDLKEFDKSFILIDQVKVNIFKLLNQETNQLQHQLEHQQSYYNSKH